jgi:hypothetical protein
MPPLLPKPGHRQVNQPLQLYQACYSLTMWTVEWHPDAQAELMQLPLQEQLALDHAAEKLAALGPALPFPHQSAVRGATGLRELRPRAGRSQWRALYRRRGDRFIIAAVAPEAEDNQQGFDQAVRWAQQRLEG